MKLIVTIALFIQISFAAITICQQQDYLGVIGGSTYTVSSVVTAMNSLQTIVAVGGQLTNATPTSVAFFYLLSTKTCQLIRQNQFPDYPQGIQAISFSPDNYQLAMVAYSATQEFLIVVEMTSSTYEANIYNTGTQSDVVRTLGLLGVGYDRYFIFGAQKIRKLFGGGNLAEKNTGPVFRSLDFGASVIRCATKTSSAIYALIQQNGSTSMILTKFDYSLNELHSYSANNGCPTCADNSARMSSAVGPPTSTAVAVCVDKPTGQVQFTLYVSDDVSHEVILSSNYLTTGSAKCLGVRAKDGSNADYVLIDDVSTLWWYSINFDSGTLQARQTLTSASSEWLSDQAILGQGYSLFPGRATKILGVSNGYFLGFVRIQEDGKWSTSSQPQISINALVTDPTPVLGQGATVTEAYTMSTVQLTQVLPPTFSKSQWTEDFCPNVVDKSLGISTCIYWAIYDNPQAVAVLDTSRKDVPKEACLCPQTSRDYIDITLALQQIRQVCFPYLKKAPKQIPQSSTSKYLVEQNGNFWNWPSKIEKELASKSVAFKYEQDTDDKVNFPGDHFNIKFAGRVAANKVIQIKRGQNFKQVVATPSKRMQMTNQDPTVQITCWSQICPGQLLINKDTMEMMADSSDICDSELNKVFIYKIEMYWPTFDVLEYSTVTFNFTCPKLKSPININLPWDQWVLLNGKNNKYRPTPLTKEQQANAALQQQEISEDDVASALSDVSSEALRVISKWTNKQVAQAVDEARARKDKIAKTIVFSSKVGNQGNLRLSFSNPVALPSYLLIEGGNTTESNSVVDSDLSNPDDLTANSRRRRRMKCVGGVCPDLPVQEEAPTPTEGEDGFTDSGEENSVPQEEEAAGDGQDAVPQEEDPAGDGQDASGEEEDASGDGENVQCDEEESECAVERGREEGDQIAPQEIVEGAPTEVIAKAEEQEKEEEKEEEEEDTQCDVEPCEQVEQPPMVEEPILDQIDCNSPENKDAVACGGSDPTICPYGSYFDKITNACKRYVLYFGEWNTLLQISIVPDPNRDPAQALKNLAYTYHVSAATVDYIDIQIDFENPLKVTVRDKVEFKLRFNLIEPALPGVSGRRLVAERGLTMFQAQLTPQLPKGGVKNLETAAASLQAATLATVVGATVLQILLSGALAQIWGMINGIQIIIYLPLLAIQFPANALMIIDKILIVACFDIPYLNMEDIFGEELWVAGDDVSLFTDLRDNELLTSGMTALGFETRMLSASLGSVFIFMTLSFGLLALIGLLEMLSRSGKFETFSKPQNRGSRFLNYLKKKFLWNYFIRLFFECCLELIIATWLGLKYGHFWNPDFPVPVTAATVICLGLSFCWFITTASLPIFFISFYWYNWKKVKDEDFEATFGCVYEGLKTDSKLALVYPIFFVVRRCLLLIAVIAGYQFIWLQIMLQLALCFFIILYVYMTWPFEDDTQNKLDIMNETTTAVLLYLIYMFSDLIPEEETKYMIGYFFIVVLISNLLVHLTLIGISLVKDVIEKVKGWVQACKKKKSKRIIVKGTDMMKDQQLFVIRKRSEQDSVVESSGELSDYTSRSSVSQSELTSRSAIYTSRSAISESDYTSRSNVSDAELLQGNMQKFQLLDTNRNCSSDSGLGADFCSWRKVSKDLDQITFSLVDASAISQSGPDGKMQMVQVNSYSGIQGSTANVNGIDLETDSNNRIETDK